MIRNEDFLPIQGWMRSLNLTDKQLLIYALIWSYSRDGRSCWRGTAKDLGDWAGCKDRNAKYIIRQLEDMGLVGHDVVSWTNGRKGGVRSEFWAVTPDKVADSVKGSRTRINWTGKGKGVGQRIARGGRAKDCPTPLTVSRYSNNSSCGGKYNARTRAKKTTTTGFLFENDESGLAPGLDLAQLSLPYEQTWFVDAVKLLLQQPAWTSKSAAAVQIVLDDLGALNDDMAATYICRLAVRREWDDISNARKIADDDAEKISAYAGEVYAHQEGAIA